MFSWSSKWKSGIQVWDDLFGNLVDISSDLYDDDMFAQIIRGTYVSSA